MLFSPDVVLHVSSSISIGLSVVLCEQASYKPKEIRKGGMPILTVASA
jgi:hypothetical protein